MGRGPTSVSLAQRGWCKQEERPCSCDFLSFPAPPPPCRLECAGIPRGWAVTGGVEAIGLPEDGAGLGG